MLNRLLQEFYQAPNNGRQLASLPDGRRLLVTHTRVSGPAQIGVCSGAVDSLRLADFSSNTVLVGEDGGIDGAGSSGLGACAQVDDRGVVHLAWTATDGIRHAQAEANFLDAGEWTAANTVVSGEVWLGDLLQSGRGLHALYREAGPTRDEEGIGLAYLCENEWQTRRLWSTAPTYPPVGDVDGEGWLHMTWGDVAGQLWYGRVSPQSEADAEPLQLCMEGRQPTILALRDGVLLVYEDRYPHIHYLFLRDGEVACEGPLTWRHPWFMGDLVHSPQLSRDRHGVAWCSFVDNTRRSTFRARWMGAGFDELANGPRWFYRAPHFDWNLLPIARLSAEKESTSGQLGMLLGLEPPLEGQEYRTVRVPDHPCSAGEKVLFLDGLEVGQMRGVRVEVQEAQRHPSNPLLDVGPRDAFDSDRVFNHGAVLRDGGRFRMWYGAIHVPDSQVPWWDTIHCGYAESKDGIAWERVRVGLAQWQNSRDNNRVPHLRHSPLMIRDDADPDQNRRYKSLYVWNSGEMSEMAATGKYGMTYDTRDEFYPAILFTSPDGLDLTAHEARIVFPDGAAKPFSIIPQSMFRDENEPDAMRRWKAYGFTSLNLRRRGTAFLYSADAITWYAHPETPVLDPAVRGIPAVVGGPESQIHDTVVFPYAGYYVALYQYQHDADHLDIELAVSRDGETFTHLHPGAKVLPLGEEGAWDSEHIVMSMPVFLDEEIHIYYGGGRVVEVEDEADRARLGDQALRFLPGLATLRLDGFTCARLDTGNASGTLTTIPFTLDAPHQLRVNACCDAEHALRVEIIAADRDEPLSGYSFAECVPVARDGMSIKVRWQDADALPVGPTLRLRFHFAGDEVMPQLYAYHFA